MENIYELKEGQLIFYVNKYKVEIGKIKSITDGGAFVYFSEGETAAKTSFDSMLPIVNERCITDTNLGGEK